MTHQESLDLNSIMTDSETEASKLSQRDFLHQKAEAKNKRKDPYQTSDGFTDDQIFYFSEDSFNDIPPKDQNIFSAPNTNTKFKQTSYLDLIIVLTVFLLGVLFSYMLGTYKNHHKAKIDALVQ